MERVVWLGQGLVEDRDTDGHVDLIAAFTKPGQVLVQTVPEGNPNFDNCRENVQRLEAAGIEVVEMPYLPYTEVDGETVACGYMNFYLCNGAVIVPVCGADTRPRRAEPDRRVLPRPRGGARPGRGDRVGWRRPALHHAAGPGEGMNKDGRPEGRPSVPVPQRSWFRACARDRRTGRRPGTSRRSR